MGTFYGPVLTLFIVTTIVLSLSLMLSDARKRKWLNLGGFFSLLVSVITLSFVIWNAMSPLSPREAVIAQQINEWITLIGAFVPVFPIMNFYAEFKPLDKEHGGSRIPPLSAVDSLILVIGVVVLVAALVTGPALVSENAWKKNLVTQARGWEKLFDARTHSNVKGETLTYKLLFLLDYDSAKQYPFVVCLPYEGGIEGCPPAQMLITDINRRKYPSFMFIPDSPVGTSWGGVPNYLTIDTLVLEAIDALKEEFESIDDKRVYVTGVSKGGYGAWHFIGVRPDMFAAAIPVCGGGNPDLAPKIVDVAVWAFHGEDDKNVPVAASRDMIAAIKKAGGNPKYTEFTNRGHNIWNGVSSTPGLLQGLFEQKRRE